MNATLKYLAGTFGCLTVICAMMLLHAIAGSVAFAQSFEYEYGGSCIENGYGGAQPVSTGGYIACGRTQSFNNGVCGSPKTYIVRTDDNGARLWEISYRISDQDSANDIRECANGDFIVVGSVRSGTGSICKNHADIYAMRIDNTGTILWVYTFGSFSGAEEAYSVQEATLSAGPGTAAGDFIIAGHRYPEVDPTAGEGYLLRIDANGGLIWDCTYTLPKHSKTYFHAVVEAKVNNSSDIIAAGYTRLSAINYNYNQALLVRVNGANGNFTNTGHGAMVWGNSGWTQSATKVIELAQGPNAGDIVITGARQHPTQPNSLRQIIVVRVDPDPDNGPLAEQAIVTDILPGNGGHQPWWLQEITTTIPGYAVGDLVISGTSYLDLTATSPTRAFILGIDSDTLAPNAAGIQQYGGLVNTRGYSVHEVADDPGQRSAGFILAGTYVGGTEQLYLVKTDPSLTKECPFVSPVLRNGVTLSPWASIRPDIDSLDSTCHAEGEPTEFKRGEEICFQEMESPRKTNGSSFTLTLSDMGPEGTLAIYPNPLKQGTDLIIDLTVSPADGTADITITNIKGDAVYSDKFQPSGGAVSDIVNTKGWASGSYLIKVAVGSKRYTRRVVVVE